jgi:hypothetical protein
MHSVYRAYLRLSYVYNNQQPTAYKVSYGEIKRKGKAIPVTGHGGPYGYEASKLPNFLDNRLTDGGEVTSFTRRPPFTRRKIPGTYFC